MITKEISLFFEMYTQLYVEERYSEIVRLISPPLPIYMPTGIKVNVTGNDIRASLSEIMARAHAAGMVRVEHDIVSIRESMQTGSAVVLIRWHYFDAFGETISSSEAECYLARDEDYRLRLRMFDYKKIAFSSETRELQTSSFVSKTLH